MKVSNSIGFKLKLLGFNKKIPSLSYLHEYTKQCFNILIFNIMPIYLNRGYFTVFNCIKKFVFELSNSQNEEKRDLLISTASEVTRKVILKYESVSCKLANLRA